MRVYLIIIFYPPLHMADLSPAQRRRLEDMGREPISLPAEIYFGGNEKEQMKHGTHNHPNIVKHKLRIAMDRLARAQKSQMSDTERASLGGLEGDALIARLTADIHRAQEALADVLGLKFEKDIQELAFTEKKPKKEKVKMDDSELEKELPEPAIVDDNELIKIATSGLPAGSVAGEVKKKPGRPSKAS